MPQAAPCAELRLGELVILWWSATARGERIGGGPVRDARLTEREGLTGPSAPRFATPQRASDLTPRISRRAERGGVVDGFQGNLAFLFHLDAIAHDPQLNLFEPSLPALLVPFIHCRFLAVSGTSTTIHTDSSR